MAGVMLDHGQPQDYLQDTSCSSLHGSTDTYDTKCISKTSITVCRYPENLANFLGFHSMLRGSPYAGITKELEKEILYYKTQYEEIRSDRDHAYRKYQSILETHQSDKMQLQEKLDSLVMIRNQGEREIELLERSLTSNHTEKEDQAKYLAEKRDKVVELETCIKDSEINLQQTRQMKKEHEILWMELNAKLHDRTSDINRAQKTISQFKGRYRDLQEKNSELAEKNQQILETISNLERKNNCLEAALHDADSKWARESMALKEKIPQRDTLTAGKRAIEASLKNTLLEISDIQDEVEAMEKELVRKEGHMNELEMSLSGLRDHQKQLQREIACLTTDSQKVNNEMNKTHEKCEMLKSEEMKCKAEIDNMEKIIAQKDEEKYALLEELQHLKEENSYIMIRKSNAEETHRNLSEELKKLQFHIDPAVNTSEIQDKEIDRLTTARKHNQEEITRLQNHLLIMNENINNGFEHLDNLQKDLQGLKNSNAKLIAEIDHYRREAKDGRSNESLPSSPITLDYGHESFRPRSQKETRREAGSVKPEENGNYSRQATSRFSDSYLLDCESKKDPNEDLPSSPLGENMASSYGGLSGREYWSMYRESRYPEDNENYDSCSMIDDKVNEVETTRVRHTRRIRSSSSLSRASSSHSVMTAETSEDKELRRMAESYSYTNCSESLVENHRKGGDYTVVSDQSNVTVQLSHRSHQMYQSMDSLVSVSTKNNDYLKSSNEQSGESELVIGSKSGASSVNGDLSLIEDSSMRLSVESKENLHRQKQNYTPCSFNSASDTGEEMSEAIRCDSLLLDHTPCTNKVMRYRNRFRNAIGSDKESIDNLDQRIFGGAVKTKN